MQFVSCGKGHYYNPAESATCPQCAREAAGGGGGFTAGGGFGFDPIGATEPVGGYGSNGGGMGGMDPIGATEPLGGFGGGNGGGNGGYASVTMPAPGGGDFLTTGFFEEPHEQTMPENGVQDYGKTTFASDLFNSATPGAAEEAIKPVVGWLVCANGASKGRDFRIHAQNNYVGRARHMDICIEGDTAISSERAAIVAYDDEQKVFYFAPGLGQNLLRLNGKAIFSAVELQAYDRVTIGKSEFLFIPLCGERFDWNEKENEKN